MYASYSDCSSFELLQVKARAPHWPQSQRFQPGRLSVRRAQRTSAESAAAARLSEHHHTEIVRSGVEPVVDRGDTVIREHLDRALVEEYAEAMPFRISDKCPCASDIQIWALHGNHNARFAFGWL